MPSIVAGESFLSCFLESLLHRLDWITKRCDPRLKLNNLTDKLVEVREFLNDAEVSEFVNSNIRRWLLDLEDAIYDVDDLVDEIITDAGRSDIVDEITTDTARSNSVAKSIRRAILKRVPDILNPTPTPKLRSEVKLVVRRLEKIVIEARDSDLQKKKMILRSRSESFERFQSKDEELIVCGRDKDKDEIVKLLLSDDASDDDDDGISVISIVGEEGVGKTTLAQLAFNDQRMKMEFDLSVWICVGNDFDICEVMKTILVAVIGDKYSSEIKDLTLIQTKLEESLKGKKFLLALDDVWENYTDGWKILKNTLSSGAKGSKIIVTARSGDRSFGKQSCRYHLRGLSEEELWALFTKHAFGNESPSAHSYQSEIGKDIVRNCNGSPLAVKAIGTLLRYIRSAEDWGNISESISGVDTVPTVLTLCYSHLPADQKRCFAYCSIFPYNYEFDKEKLVRLWMAEGFLYQSNSNDTTHIREEDAGHHIFLDLLSRSFFQRSFINKSCFVIHSLFNDLTQSVSQEFCFRLKDGDTSYLSATVRHASYVRGSNDSSQKFDGIFSAERLRTFLPVNSPSDNVSCEMSNDVLKDLLVKLPRLRVLSMPFYDFTEMPNSIGKLKHLRYLDLSHTALKSLPEAVSSLYNLQTLDLTNCHFINKLPDSMWMLISLRHLLISGAELKEMPLKMSSLTNLQTLSNFYVGKGGSKIDELSKLLDLRGALSISNLHNLDPHPGTLNGKLTELRHLDDLQLEWSSENEDPERDQGVLENLQPSTELKRLTIESYMGKKFPYWLEDSLLSRLVFLHLSNCKNCLQLLPLGQLPSLEVLIIKGFDGVNRLGEEFYGKHSPSNKSFQSLKTLQFDGMLEWEEWGAPETEHDGFPRLLELQITNCPNLKGKIPKGLSSLKKLVISGSSQLADSLTSLDQVVPAQCEVWIDGKKVHPTTKNKDALPVSSDTTKNKDVASKDDDRREEFKISAGQSSKASDVSPWEKKPPATEIPSLSSEVPPQDFLKTSNEVALEANLDVNSTGVVHQVDDGMQHEYSSSGILEISDVAKLSKLPANLHSLRFEGCNKLEAFPFDILNSNPSLQHLYVIDCDSLVSFAKGGHPITLKTLHIRNCRKLIFPFTLEMWGQCAELEHLCVWSSCDSLESFPLQFFPKLRILCLKDCMKLNSLSIQKGSCLQSLKTLEIRDCPDLVSFPQDGLSAPNLTSILFSNCKNLQSLPEQMCQLESLQSLFVSKCPQLQSLPTDGLPASLNLLCITFCEKITISRELKLNSLDALSHFEIEGGCENIESFPDEGLLPSNLISLRISRLPDLKFLDGDGFQQLTSLEKLEITFCERLRSLPDELPSSLSFLCIKECQILKSKLQNKNGTEWLSIADIPNIYLDDEGSD